METSRLTSKYQATIPQKIRDFLGLDKGDVVRFDVADGKVRLSRKARARKKPVDISRLTAVEQVFAADWLSPEDEEAFKDL